MIQVKVIKVIKVIIGLYGMYCDFIKIYNNLDSILRNLLVAGNIVTVSYEQMREIRKELG